MAAACCYAEGMKILVKWLLCAAALLGVAYVYSGVQVHSFGSAMIAALVIGLLNTVIRPILVVLTLPVTIITVGLFLLVVNGLMFWMASGLLGGFHVTSFWAAMLGALIYSVLGLFIDRLVAQLFPE
jgi:putative membrane protein